MKKIFYVSFMFIAIISMIGCNGKGKKTAQLNDKDSVVAKTEADTTVYGVFFPLPLHPIIEIIAINIKET